MESLIYWLVSNPTATLLGLWAVIVAARLVRPPARRPPDAALEIATAWYFLLPIGVGNVINFLLHAFMGAQVAAFIGWADSPFQLEVAVASLGMGLAGLLAFRGTLGFRVAALIPPSVFTLGAAVGHVRQMLIAHNFSPGNAGSVFWTDIIVPLIGLALLVAQWRRTRGHE